MKVSKNSKNQTHTSEKPKQPEWRAKRGGPFRIFKHPLLQNIKNLKGGQFVGKHSEKVSQCRKN